MADTCTHGDCTNGAVVRILDGGERLRCAEHLAITLPDLGLPKPIGPVVTVDTSTVTSNQVRELLALVLEREREHDQRLTRANELLTAPALGAYRRSEVGIER